MPGRRVHSNQQITDWLANAQRLTDEVNPPVWAKQEVFNALLNVQQLPDHVYTDEEAKAAFADALAIVEALNLPLALLGRAFHFALTCTSAREQVQILKDIPGIKDTLHKLQ